MTDTPTSFGDDFDIEEYHAHTCTKRVYSDTCRGCGRAMESEFDTIAEKEGSR